MRVVIASERSVEREKCREAVLGLGLQCTAADCVAASELRVRLTGEPVADLVLVVVGPDSNSAMSAVEYAGRQTTVPVYAVGPLADAEQMHRALHTGARGYLDQARLREELSRTIDTLRQRGVVDFRRGRSVVITAAHAGAGVTTVASGLAFALSTEQGLAVVAEFGNGAPELALDLDLKPNHSLADLVRESHRMDATMVRQVAVPHPGGAHVLAYKPETLDPEPIDPKTVREFLVLLRSLYDWAVLDLGHGSTPTAREAIALADAVVVVVRLDVPGLRLARAYLSNLLDNGLAPEKLFVAANRYGQSGQLGWKKAESALKHPVKVWLPDDPGVLSRSLNAGKPLASVARGSALNRGMRTLAAALAERSTVSANGKVRR